MKKCSYCGREYSDEYSECAIDQSPLESTAPQPVATAPAPVLEDECSEPRTDTEENESETETPDGFVSVGRYEPLEAKRLLERFEKASVRFQIDKIDWRTLARDPATYGGGFINATAIEIFVHKDDQQKAGEILTADWRV